MYVCKIHVKLREGKCMLQTNPFFAFSKKISSLESQQGSISLRNGPGCTRRCPRLCRRRAPTPTRLPSWKSRTFRSPISEITTEGGEKHSSQVFSAVLPTSHFQAFGQAVK